MNLRGQARKAFTHAEARALCEQMRIARDALRIAEGIAIKGLRLDSKHWRRIEKMNKKIDIAMIGILDYTEDNHKNSVYNYRKILGYPS